MVRNLKISVMAVALMGSGYAQSLPASNDPHEDPTVQNSDAGKKSAGQPVAVPKAAPRPKLSKSQKSKTKKAPPVALAGQKKPIESDDVILGEWNLVIEKSKFNPGPPPKSEVRTYVKTPDGIVATVSTTQSDGKERTVSYPWQSDGKEHAVVGSDLLDTIRLERVDNLTAEATLRHGDKIIASERRTLALDGKTMTIVVKDISSDDRPIDVTAVYEKK